MHDKQGWPRKRRRSKEMKVNGEKMSTMIDEAYLYKYMPQAEQYLLAEIPPEEELDHKFSRRFERKMKALIKYERRTPWERKFYKRMKVALVALAVILFVVFGSAMSVKAYRSRVIEFFLEVLENKTSYSVQEVMPEGETMVPVESSYVPEGFAVVRRVSNNSEYFVQYESNSVEKILYNQAILSMVGRYWDTEERSVEEIRIGKQIVSVTEENDGKCTIYWNDDCYAYRLVGIRNVELDELMKMVRSIIKIKK